MEVVVRGCTLYYTLQIMNTHCTVSIPTSKTRAVRLEGPAAEHHKQGLLESTAIPSERAQSHLISEAKEGQAWLVFGWEKRVQGSLIWSPAHKPLASIQHSRQSMPSQAWCGINSVSTCGCLDPKTVSKKAQSEIIGTSRMGQWEREQVNRYRTCTFSGCFNWEKGKAGQRPMLVWSFWVWILAGPKSRCPALDPLLSLSSVKWGNSTPLWVLGITVDWSVLRTLPKCLNEESLQKALNACILQQISILALTL